MLTLHSHLHHPHAIPTSDTTEPGPRAHVTPTFGVVELIQSLWWSGCLLVPLVMALEKAIKPGRAEWFPFLPVNAHFVPVYTTHMRTWIPASEHPSLHLVCPEQAEYPSWPLSDCPSWLLTGTSLLSQILHCSYCEFLLLIWESGLGKGFLKPIITNPWLTLRGNHSFLESISSNPSENRKSLQFDWFWPYPLRKACTW